jgi:hypothetical protein
MSSNRTCAGGSAGAPHGPEQADLDSVGARSAAAESGSEGIGGAPPASTARNSSINTEFAGFRLLKWAMCGLCLVYPGGLEPASLDALDKFKTHAQLDHIEDDDRSRHLIALHAVQGEIPGSDASRSHRSPGQSVWAIDLGVKWWVLTDSNCRPTD